jgi:short-subunit dehydrogenase
VVVLSVHDTALLLGFTKAAADNLPQPKFVPLELVSSLREALQTFSAVVLTGGSSGIGKSFIELAGKLLPELRFCNLSRSKPDIKSRQLNVCHIGSDLSDAAALARAADGVVDWLTREAPAGQILLINNSGFGAYGRFPEPNLGRQLQLLDVNIRGVVDLTGRMLPILQQRGGAVMNIASTAAFQPMPFMATYGASKAFVLHWTLALNEELRGTGVRAIAVCPGPTATKFFQRAGLKADGMKGFSNMSAEAVVVQAIRALGKRRSLAVTGWMNTLSAMLGGMAPKRAAAWVSGKLVARTRLDHRPS